MEKLKHYEIAEKLGEGKHGPTFLAMDTLHQRTVVIKRLDHPATRTEEWKSCWQMRRKQLEQIEDANLTKYYALEEDQKDDGHQFIVREHIEGQSLTELMRPGLPTPARILAIALELTRQLKTMHDHDLVHANITPNNVIIESRGRARLVDDGLGFARETWLQFPNAPAGEIVCLAPELFAEKSLGPKSDHYALGALIYLMWTGQPIFPDDEPETLIRSITGEPVSFEVHPAREVPGMARLLIGKLLSKDSEERFMDTDELIFTLRGMIAHSSKPEPTVADKKWSPSPRLYQLLSILALLLIILWLVITSDQP